MKVSYKLSMAAIVASLSLVGCGSDSDSTPETVTGQFVDTYVAGLNYECSSGTTGITNDMGEYTCNVGDTVEFSLGGYVLGTATASAGIVTPEDIQPDNADAALNVAQLLQSLDADPTDDIITIPEDFTALDDVNISLDDPLFDDLMETELEITLVTEEEAQTHLDEAELKVLLAGNTFYLVGSDNTGDNWIDSVVFNSDATSLTWASLTDTETGSHSVVIEGNTITLDGDEGPFTLTFIEEASDKIVFHGIEGGAVVEEDFMFFEQADAEAYYNELVPGTFVSDPIPITQAMLDGKTFYDYEEDTNYDNVVIERMWSKMTLNNGILSRTEYIEEMNGDTVVDSFTDSFTVSYEILDGKVRVSVPAMEGDPAEYIWWTLLSETDTTWTMRDEEDNNQDGTIETEFTYVNVYDLVKPTDFPDSL